MSQNFAAPWKIVPPSDLLEKNPHLKTTLAVQLAQKMEKRGFMGTWTARKEEAWASFESRLKMELSPEIPEQVERQWGLCKSGRDKAYLLTSKVGVLQQITDGKLLLILDNLETVQDSKKR